MTSTATPQITIEKALSKAKIAMMMLPDTVFFSTLCTSLEVVISDQVPTAGTDGRKLFINKDFFFGLTEAERIFLLHMRHFMLLIYTLSVGVTETMTSLMLLVITLLITN